MTTATATAPALVVDVRTIAPRERHLQIFKTFEGLKPKQVMELVNDHDPRPLRHQFEAKYAGAFTWNYAESGPDTWRVNITRTGDPHAFGGCCGGCGGS